MQNIKFICMVDMLKKMSTGNYIPLSWWDGKEDRSVNIVYDDYAPNEDGTYKVVWEFFSDEDGNNGVLSYFDSYCEPNFEYEVIVNINDYDKNLNHITIVTRKEDERPIMFFIQNGEWEAW